MIPVFVAYFVLTQRFSMLLNSLPSTPTMYIS